MDCPELLLPLEPELPQSGLPLLHQVDPSFEQSPQCLIVVREASHQLDVVGPCHDLLTIPTLDVVLHQLGDLLLVLNLVGLYLGPIQTKLVKVILQQHRFAVLVQCCEVLHGILVEGSDLRHLLNHGRVPFKVKLRAIRRGNELSHTILAEVF